MAKRVTVFQNDEEVGEVYLNDEGKVEWDASVASEVLNSVSGTGLDLSKAEDGAGILAEVRRNYGKGSPTRTANEVEHNLEPGEEADDDGSNDSE